MTISQNNKLIMNSSARKWLAAGALMCMLSVVIGAFAAHGLKAVLSEYALNIVQTGAKYQMYHGLGIMICGLLIAFDNGYTSAMNRVNISFLLGCILFSGSLYFLALLGLKIFAIVTPIGGLCFIAGWIMLVWTIIKTPSSLNTPNLN